MTWSLSSSRRNTRPSAVFLFTQLGLFRIKSNNSTQNSTRCHRKVDCIYLGLLPRLNHLNAYRLSPWYTCRQDARCMSRQNELKLFTTGWGEIQHNTTPHSLLFFRSYYIIIIFFIIIILALIIMSPLPFVKEGLGCVSFFQEVSTPPTFVVCPIKRIANS